VPAISAKTPTLLILASSRTPEDIDEHAEPDQHAAQQHGVARGVGRAVGLANHLEPRGHVRQAVAWSASATEPSVITAQDRLDPAAIQPTQSGPICLAHW